ncbi:MAG: hypothetical protein N4A70_09930 [Pelagimonas sp.]|jgi:hypothetical protein|nr:hypothetical protein [Pelagimonas sp.]
MNQSVVVAFALCFAVGPVLCALALRLPARAKTIGLLAGAVIALVVWGVEIKESQPMSMLFAFWLAWVVGIALVTLALRHHARDRQLKRLLMVLGILATTMPWFGMATATSLMGALRI